MDQLEDRLKTILINRCGVSEEAIRPEATLQADLELDSLDAVEFAMAMEDEFNIKILDQDMRDMRTVGDVLALVRRLQVNHAPITSSVEFGKPM